ncbi:hypothetical protein WR25_10134 [Diploscapter pachys]|uniref:Uncharacterized protein n=1 Tax=Diploscapter pachys TaxID=2018661 RepID=A0A2A2JWV5_9BILA|nr:hypothetical protein WR25_10134 [Diploscapter pachys]
MARQDPTPRHPRLDIGGERTLPFEGMDAPRNVDHQRVGGQQRHRRAVARAAIRQPLQPVHVGMRIGRKHLQLGHARAGIGQRQPRLQPGARRGQIGRGQPDRLAHRLDEGDRRLTADEQMRPGGAQPLDREPRKDQRQIAARHGNSWHHDPTPRASAAPRGRHAGAHIRRRKPAGLARPPPAPDPARSRARRQRSTASQRRLPPVPRRSAATAM